MNEIDGCVKISVADYDKFREIERDYNNKAVKVHLHYGGLLTDPPFEIVNETEAMTLLEKKYHCGIKDLELLITKQKEKLIENGKHIDMLTKVIHDLHEKLTKKNRWFKRHI